MAAPSPATDPIWAYNTPGWTNQGNTGDVEGAQLTGTTFSANAFLSEPEGLSGYIARSIDPTVASLGTTGQAMTDTIAWFAAVEVLAPAQTKKLYLAVKYASAAEAIDCGLYNFAGVQLTTATVTPGSTTLYSASASWAAAQVLSPGTYYVGAVSTAANDTMASVTLSVEQATLPQATTFAANVLNWRFFQQTVSAGALPGSLTGSIAGSTVGWFAGLG
jgi:hypothetical protein